MSRFLVVVAVASMFCLNGCLDMYFDVISNTDGTFTLRKSMVAGPEFFSDMKLFAGASDSPEAVRHALIDTLEKQMRARITPVTKLHGVTFTSVYDSTADTLTYIILEVRCDGIGSLQAIGNAVLQSTDSNDKTTIDLAVTNSGKVTQLDYSFHSPESSSADSMNAMMALFLGDHALHIRTFSSNMIAPEGPKYTKINGGFERSIKIADLVDSKKLRSLETRFLFGNAAH